MGRQRNEMVQRGVGPSIQKTTLKTAWELDSNMLILKAKSESLSEGKKVFNKVKWKESPLQHLTNNLWTSHPYSQVEETFSSEKTENVNYVKKISAWENLPRFNFAIHFFFLNTVFSSSAKVF